LSDIVQADVSDLPFGNDKFDLVLALDVLEHVEDHKKALLECRRVLRKGGSVLITVPALSFLWSKHDVGQGHFRRYNKKMLLDLVSETDYKIDYIGYFNFFLAPLIVCIRMLSKIRTLDWLANYDNSINYKLAKVGIVNLVLKSVFVGEIRLMKYIRYPVGISLVVLLKK